MTTTKRRKKGSFRLRDPHSVGLTVKPVVVRSLVVPLNGRATGHGPAKLSDIDRLVYGVIGAEGRWVLIDRHESSTGKGQLHDTSSARYIALKRRGFEVAVRHVDGVKNYWARWPHPVPELPMVTGFSFDDEFTAYGGVQE